MRKKVSVRVGIAILLFSIFVLQAISLCQENKQPLVESKSTKELINEIVEKTGSELIEAVGNVVVLHKK